MKELSQTNKLYRYPEHLILRIAKLFHLNQFELIFFSQILTEVEPCHETEADIFYHVARRIQGIEMQERSLYLYLVVIGFAVKYYLNDNITVYDQEVNRQITDFSSVFKAWAKKYSNEVLRTNPKKLNTFYIDLMKSDDQDDINFKNYNEIVEDLGKIGPAEGSDDENIDAVVDISKMEEHVLGPEDDLKEWVI